MKLLVMNTLDAERENEIREMLAPDCDDAYTAKRHLTKVVPRGTAYLLEDYVVETWERENL